MAKSSNSNKKQARQVLEDFFAFVNEGSMKDMPDSGLTSLLVKYTGFLSFYASRHPFLEYRTLNRKYVAPILEQSSPNVMEEGRVFFTKLQARLRSELAGVIDSAATGGVGQAREFFKMTGTRTVIVDPEADRFVEKFVPAGIQPGGELDLNKETVLAELVLFDLIQEFNLKPKRFQQCQKCRGFFYQWKANTMYCSLRCSNAGRQANYYRDKIKKKKKK